MPDFEQLGHGDLCDLDDVDGCQQCGEPLTPETFEFGAGFCARHPGKDYEPEGGTMPRYQPAQALKGALDKAKASIEFAIFICGEMDKSGAVQLKSELIRLCGPDLWPELENYGELGALLLAEEHDAQAEMAEAQNG